MVKREMCESDGSSWSGLGGSGPPGLLCPVFAGENKGVLC